MSQLFLTDCPPPVSEDRCTELGVQALWILGWRCGHSSKLRGEECPRVMKYGWRRSLKWKMLLRLWKGQPWRSWGNDASAFTSGCEKVCAGARELPGLQRVPPRVQPGTTWGLFCWSYSHCYEDKGPLPAIWKPQRSPKERMPTHGSTG